MDNILTTSFASFLQTDNSKESQVHQEDKYTLPSSADFSSSLSQTSTTLTAEAVQNVSVKVAASAFTKQQFHTSCKALFFPLGHGEICILSSRSNTDISAKRNLSRLSNQSGLRIGGRGGIMWTKSSLFSGGMHGFLSTVLINKIDINTCLHEEEEEFIISETNNGAIKEGMVTKPSDSNSSKTSSGGENTNLSLESQENAPTFSFLLCASNGKNNSSKLS